MSEAKAIIGEIGALLFVLGLVVLIAFVGSPNVGGKHRIRMYKDDGRLIEEWISSGNVVHRSDNGWRFMDDKTHRLILVSGDLIIESLEK